MDRKVQNTVIIIAVILFFVVAMWVSFGSMLAPKEKPVSSVTIIGETPTPEPPTDNLLLDLISPIVVLKGSKQYEQMYPTPTPNVTESITVLTTIPAPEIIPTVTVIPTKEVRTIDPFTDGERWERQWYRWLWHNVSGYQSADRGIVVYRHVYLDSYTYWDDAWGQYFKVYPAQNNRFIAVYVHQEDFSPDNSGIWGYGNGSFKLQYNQQLHDQYQWLEPVYRISELEDTYNDYYNIRKAGPYGAERIFGGISDAKTGGYHIEYRYSLWSGQGNSWDGYLLFQVPDTLTDRDFRIVSNFAGKGVNWRFDADAEAGRYPISNVGVLPVRTIETPATLPTENIVRQAV
jgi:hypothetical protein